MLPNTHPPRREGPAPRKEPEVSEGDHDAPRPPRLSGAPLLGNLPEFLSPHTCLGAALADVQVIATLALLLELADIELQDPERPLEMKYTPYPLPEGDKLRVRLRR
jgi:cytochrome P450